MNDTKFNLFSVIHGTDIYQLRITETICDKTGPEL